jgi:hypothetical protein
LSGSVYNRGSSLAVLCAKETIASDSEPLLKNRVDEISQLSTDIVDYETASVVDVLGAPNAVCLSDRVLIEEMSLSSAVSEGSSEYNKEDSRKIVDVLDANNTDVKPVKLETSNSKLKGCTEVQSLLSHQDLPMHKSPLNECSAVISNSVSESVCKKQLVEQCLKHELFSENELGCKDIQNSSKVNGVDSEFGCDEMKHMVCIQEKSNSAVRNSEDYLISCAQCGVSGMWKYLYCFCTCSLQVGQ